MAITMVKLPDLELKEVEQIVEALEHYRAVLGAARSEDASEYAHLVKMLGGRLKAQLPAAGLAYQAPAADAPPEDHRGAGRVPRLKGVARILARVEAG
jgi:hypothetical protein